MLSKGNYFPEQNSNEQIILFIRRHWLSFLYWLIFIGIMIIVPAIIFLVLRNDILYNMAVKDQEYLIIGISAYILITLAVFLTAWISFYLNVVIITPEHLVDIRQNGLFNRRVCEQSLLRVQDVSSHRRGLMQTFFHFGTVLVETAGDLPNFDMPNLPDPDKIANEILKLHEELAKKTGFDENEPDEEPEFERQNNTTNNNMMPATKFQELLKKDKENLGKKQTPAAVNQPKKNIEIGQPPILLEEAKPERLPAKVEESHVEKTVIKAEQLGEVKYSSRSNNLDYGEDKLNHLIGRKNDDQISKNVSDLKKEIKTESLQVQKNFNFKQEGELEDGKTIKL